MTQDDDDKPWRYGSAGIFFAVLGVVWFGLFALLLQRSFPPPGGFVVALYSALPFFIIAAVAVCVRNITYLERWAWPVSLVLLCVVGLWYGQGFVYGVLSVK